MKVNEIDLGCVTNGTSAYLIAQKYWHLGVNTYYSQNFCDFTLEDHVVSDFQSYKVS